MAEKFDRKFFPHPEYRFWLHDPEGDGLTFWRTAEDRDLFAAQMIDGYLADDGWSEETGHICAGEVTHIAQVKDKTMRPPDDELDEGVDGEGNYWVPDMAWRGNYTLEPIAGNTGEVRNGQ